MYRIIKSYDSKNEKTSNSELLTEQQFYLQCKIQTGEIIRQQKNVQEFPNENLNIS
jgi:ribosomal protein L27